MKFSWQRQRWWQVRGSFVSHKRWHEFQMGKIKAEGTPVGPFCYLNPNKRHRKQFAELPAGFARRAERQFKQEQRGNDISA
jgi:hypothetical protein